MLVGAELRAFAPYLADDLAGAVWCPREGHANPLLAAPLFALRAIERGAAVRTQAGVTAVEVARRAGGAPLHRHDDARHDPRAPAGQRRRRLGERASPRSAACASRCAPRAST